MGTYTYRAAMEYNSAEEAARRAAMHAQTIDAPVARHAIVTGGTGQIGRRVARHLSHLGYRVTLGCRRQVQPPHGLTRAQRTVRAIHNTVHRPGVPAFVAVEELDLANALSVDAFAARMTGHGLDVPRVHLVVHCATAPTHLAYNDDRRDAHFAVQLGWVRLIERLMPCLIDSDNSRIVTLIYPTYRFGRPDWHDPQGIMKTDRTPQCAERHAELVKATFVYELAVRLDTASQVLEQQRRELTKRNGQSYTPGNPLPLSVLAMPRECDITTRTFIKRGHRTGHVVAAPAAEPVIQAAVNPGARNGELYTLDEEERSALRPLDGRVRDAEWALRLWDRMTQLTGNGDAIMAAISPGGKRTPNASPYRAGMTDVRIDPHSVAGMPLATSYGGT